MSGTFTFALGQTVTVKGKPGRGMILDLIARPGGENEYLVRYAADAAAHSPVENWWRESDLVA